MYLQLRSGSLACLCCQTFAFRGQPASLREPPMDGKDRTFSGENVMADQKSVFDGYTNVLLFCFFSYAHTVAPFYLHVTVFTKENVKHANKGELIYR